MQIKVQQGLRSNWKQFVLLVVINGFVGAMVGVERSLLPLFAKTVFGIEAATATLSFIIAFGVIKAFSNYFAGALANKIGRRNLLIIGWLFALPVPFILLYAPNWNWVIFANVLLGINQGLTWSTNVLMKIELAGEKQRGLAMGLNEFAGYLAVAIAAFFTGWLATQYGIRPYPFYVGIVIAFTGFFLTLLFVKDTHGHALTEQQNNRTPKLTNPFWQTTWRHPVLGSVTQAGLVNNLNDGMVWGLLPIILAAHGFSFSQIGIVAALYPAVWGIGQLATGILSDKINRKYLLVGGMIVQGIAILLMIPAQLFWHYATAAVLLGWGTAMVYPTFLSCIAHNTHPSDRPKSLGIFRFWRDLGYAIGALLTGLIADNFGYNNAMLTIGVLTLLSGLIIQIRMTAKNRNAYMALST